MTLSFNHRLTPSSKATRERMKKFKHNFAFVLSNNKKIKKSYNGSIRSKILEEM